MRQYRNVIIACISICSVSIKKRLPIPDNSIQTERDERMMDEDGQSHFLFIEITIESSLSSISICHDLSSFSIYKFQLWQFMLHFINYWQRYHDIFCIKTIKILIYAFNVWICRWWHLFNVLRNKPQPSPASIEYILPVNRKVQCILCFIVNKEKFSDCLCFLTSRRWSYVKVFLLNIDKKYLTRSMVHIIDSLVTCSRFGSLLSV